MTRQPAQYQPHFWIFGSVSSGYLPKAKAFGFAGVGYLAADRDGDALRYYFDSPTLEQYDWAIRVTGEYPGTSDYTYGKVKQGTDFSGFAAQAHAAGLKVMANMEGADPYHWHAGRKHWTPELISQVMTDLHRGGCDRWFTECVAGWPPLFQALAETGRHLGMEYQEGDDPSYLHLGDREGAMSYPALYRQSGLVSMYHYHYRRDEKGEYASLMQEASLVYGFARAWGHPSALVYPIGYDWGESPENWEGLLKASILIRALQFRVRDIMLIGDSEDDEKSRRLDISNLTRWAQELCVKNAEEQRPVLNVVVHLRSGPDSHWHDFATSGDAITCGAFLSGYDVVTSTEPLMGSDAYYIYTAGEDKQGVLELTPEIAGLFTQPGRVFLQIGGTVPSGDTLTERWRTVLSACGVDATAKLSGGEMPAQGSYHGLPFKSFGSHTAYALIPRPFGTRLPKHAVTGSVLAEGEGQPLLVGHEGKYLLPLRCLSWQMMYPIGHLLNGAGVRATSDVWGIAGAKVSALLAIHDTDLHLAIPGLTAGAKLRVRTWDRQHQPTGDATISYTGAYEHKLKQFDFLLIEVE